MKTIGDGRFIMFFHTMANCSYRRPSRSLFIDMVRYRQLIKFNL